MKTHITKTDKLNAHGNTRTFVPLTGLEITVCNTTLDKVHIFLNADTGSMVLELDPDDARKFANMIYQVSDAIHDEWANFKPNIIKAKKPTKRRTKVNG